MRRTRTSRSRRKVYKTEATAVTADHSGSNFCVTSSLSQLRSPDKAWRDSSLRSPGKSRREGVAAAHRGILAELAERDEIIRRLQAEKSAELDEIVWRL